MSSSALEAGTFITHMCPCVGGETLSPGGADGPCRLIHGLCYSDSLKAIMEGPVNSEREDLGQVSSVLPFGLPLGLVSSAHHWLFELCESQTLRQGARDQA